MLGIPERDTWVLVADVPVDRSVGIVCRTAQKATKNHSISDLFSGRFNYCAVDTAARMDGV